MHNMCRENYDKCACNPKTIRMTKRPLLAPASCILHPAGSRIKLGLDSQVRAFNVNYS